MLNIGKEKCICSLIKTVNVMVSACKVINKQTHPDTARSHRPPRPLGGCGTGVQHRREVLPRPGSQVSGCGAWRSLWAQGWAPAGPRLGAPSSGSTGRVNVKMYQLVYVSISMAEYAENKSKEGFYAVLYTVKMKLYVERRKIF